VRSPALALFLIGLGGCDGNLEPPQKPHTVRLVEAPVALVGRGISTCSHQPAAADRWCAFARPLAEGGAELWVVNTRRALREKVLCDGSSPHCLRLTSELWTGQSLFSPTHGFYGDSLVFYASSATGNTENGYEGPVRAWRPGGGPRVISGPQGRACIGHPHSPALLCIDRERTVAGVLEFDLLAGTYGANPDQPLPRIETIRPLDRDRDILWQVGFSPRGDHLAFSDQVPEGGKVQRLRVVETAAAGQTPPHEVLRDLADWQFSPDGRQIYFLRGFNYGQGQGNAGTLAVADFPSGTNPRDLQPRVGAFEVYGQDAGSLRGIGLYQDMRGVFGRFSFMADPARPDELTGLAGQVEDAVVSPDLRYSLLLGQDERGDLATFVARNDGGGRCRIAAHPGHTVFAPTFLSSPAVLLWAEEAADNPTVIEGWLGDPDTCEVKQAWSAKLAFYEAVAGGLLWGEEEASSRTMTLRHGRFSGTSLDLARAEELRRGIDTQVTVIDQRTVLYTISDGEEAGLYLYGPLE
jgi:hypothetical protein